MENRMEYAATVDKTNEQWKKWFAHIQELRKENLKRKAAAIKARKKHDPYREMKLAKLQAKIDKLESK